MTHAELMAKLEEFRKLPAETEWLEFKEAKSNHDFKLDMIGEYFSALSNESSCPLQTPDPMKRKLYRAGLRSSMSE
jgi:hypothetical protein